MSDKQDKPLKTATGLTDDDPNAPDDEDSGTQVDEYDTEALRQAFNLPAVKQEEGAADEPADEAADEEPETEPETEPAEEADTGATEEPVKESPPVDPDDVPKFTQKQVNAFMAQEKRISREAQAVIKELEAVSGMPVVKLREAYRAQQIQQLADDHGMTEAEATVIVADREKARQLEAKVAQLEAEQVQIKRQQTYAEQKAKHTNNPNVKRYEAEIDQFARQSAGWDYDLAVVAVLGQKARDGLLQQEVANITRQQTIANVAKGNVRVEPSRQAAPTAPAASLSAEQRRIIAEMKGIVPGLTERGVAKQAELMKRQGRR